MTRSVRISLDLASDSKRRRLAAFLREFRTASNFYTDSLWKEKGKLDAKTLKRYRDGSLGYSQRASALKIALETVIATRKLSKAIRKRVRCPMFRKAVRLSKLICSIESAKCSFDFVLKLSGLVPGKRIVIPFASHARLNHWLSKPGAEILDGAIVTENYAWIYIRVPDHSPKTEGETIGLDVGMNKMIADSNGIFHGKEFKDVCAKVRRKKRGSRAKLRARRMRQNYVNCVCRRLPWQTTKTFVLEDLTGMKVGKGNRSKRSRKFLAPWSYRQVRSRLEQLAPENRVRLVFVNPKDTSRTCPSCGLENAKNREKEQFRCVECNYTNDSDYVAARNILYKALGNCPENAIPVGTCV